MRIRQQPLPREAHARLAVRVVPSFQTQVKSFFYWDINEDDEGLISLKDATSRVFFSPIFLCTAASAVGGNHVIIRRENESGSQEWHSQMKIFFWKKKP